MNRFKKIRPGVFLTCLMIGIALFSISSLSFDQISKADNKQEILSVGQVSKSVTDAKEEEQRDRFMTSTDDQYIASRGDYDRLAEARPEAPKASAAPAAEKPAAPAPKTTAPAAPAKPKAAPAPEPAAQPKSQYSSDVDVLARLIMAETQAEPYEAKVAVGAVVMNRLQSGLWADSIKGVIYQKSGGYYQFTPVENGWINKPANAECVKAAKAAMSGADPTNGAQFYYDNSVTNEWILAKPVSIKIGNMIYAY